MKKSLIYTLIMSLLVIMVMVGCAAPASQNITPNVTGTAPPTGAPAGTPAVSPGNAVVTPEGPAQGVATGVTVPVSPAPGGAAIAPGAGFVSSPSILLNNQYQNAGILVSGKGQVSATPDMATLQLGVSAQSSTVAASQNSAATAMNAVMQALKTNGIADKDIQTVGFSINPLYDYKNGTANITGYQVSNVVTVTVRDTANVSAVIDTAAAAGGDFIRVNSISFGVSDPAPYMSEARQLAVANANATATQLASLAGVVMGKPVFITESSGYFPPSPFSYGAIPAAREAATPISPGQTQITVNVEIIYEIQ